MKKILNLIFHPLDYLLEFRIVHIVQNKISNELIVIGLSVLIVLFIFTQKIYNW